MHVHVLCSIIHIHLVMSHCTAGGGGGGGETGGIYHDIVCDVYKHRGFYQPE